MKNIKTIEDIKVGDRFKGQINNIEYVIDKIYKENGRWYLLITANDVKVEKPFDYFKRLQLERI
jgi:hypothetical protein